MNRRNVIKNSILALCASLLPKILQPMDGLLEDDLEILGGNKKDKEWVRGYAKNAYSKSRHIIGVGWYDNGRFYPIKNEEQLRKYAMGNQDLSKYKKLFDQK